MKHRDTANASSLCLNPSGNDACVSGVFADIAEIQRLLEYYSFRTPHLADRFADRLSSRYRYEIFAIYGTSELLRRRPRAVICVWSSFCPPWCAWL